MEIVFATGNKHKVSEVQAVIGDFVQFKGLKDIGCTEEIPETTGTILGNSKQKAWYIFEKYGVNCFSEDTGLEVDALNGEPGVDTAIYAGLDKNAEANMNKLLVNLGDNPHRTARFRTIITLILDGKEHLFEGICEGKIGIEKCGTNGFGYDPIFIPEGFEETFAELGDDIKNKISHRAKATELLKAFLIDYK